MLKYKKGVRLGNICTQLIIGISVAEAVYSSYDLDCVITSVADYRHSATYSEHYQGNAADFRTSNIMNDEDRQEIMRKILSNLPLGFVLLFEGNHFHLAWRPKYNER